MKKYLCMPNRFEWPDGAVLLHFSCVLCRREQLGTKNIPFCDGCGPSREFMQANGFNRTACGFLGWFG